MLAANFTRIRRRSKTLSTFVVDHQSQSLVANPDVLSAVPEDVMTVRPLVQVLTMALVAVVSAIALGAQSGGTYTPPRTPWGEPDLQGIWSGDTLTPVERPAKFANRAVLTEQEAEAIEEDIASRPGRD